MACIAHKRPEVWSLSAHNEEDDNMDLGFWDSTSAIAWNAYQQSMNRAVSNQRSTVNSRNNTQAVGATDNNAKTSSENADQKDFETYFRGYVDGMSRASAYSAASLQSYMGLGGLGSYGGFGGYGSLAQSLLGGSYTSPFASLAASGRAGSKVNSAINNPNMQKLNSFTNNKVTGYNGYRRYSEYMDQVLNFPNNGFTR